MESALTANREAIEAWNGPLFDRFVRFRSMVNRGIAPFGDAALALSGPRPGDRVIDIGCGFGDSTQQIAALVGPEAEVVGVDAAENFIETARAEAAESGVDNVRFLVADVEAGLPEGDFDYAFSRFGTMFFANPVVALRHVRLALKPGGRLCMVVWRRKLDNDWIHRAERVTERYLTHPDQTDEPTCGPGPFSMANADTTSDVLRHAGWQDISLTRVDQDLWIGADIDGAIEMNMGLGPAGELIRTNGEAALPFVDRIKAEIGEALEEFRAPDGIRGPASCWVVTATAP